MTEQQLQSAVSKVIEKTKDRLIQRANKIVEIINETAIKNTKFGNDWMDFRINGLDAMIEKTLNVLCDWNGGKYDKPVKTEKDCFNKARNFWCREKSKPIANWIIHPVLGQLFQHINQFNHTSSRDKVLLYIDIIYCILHREIIFTRTSSKPLILYAMFFKNNKFKEHCKMMIKYFNLDNLNEYHKWGSVKVTKSVKKVNEKKAKSEYVRDRNRVKDLHDSFVAHLINIRSQILNCHNMNLIQHQLIAFMNWMGLKINPQLKDNDNNDNKYNDDDNDNDDFPPIIPNNDHNGIPFELIPPPIIPYHDDNIQYNDNNGTHSIRSFQGMNNYIDPLNQMHRINATQSMRNGMIQRRESVETHIEEMRLQRDNKQNRSNQNHFLCEYCSHPLQPQHFQVPSNYNFDDIEPRIINNQSVPTISTATPPQRIQEPSIPSIPTISAMPPIPSFRMEMKDNNYNQNDAVNNSERIACFRNDNDNLLEEASLYIDDIDISDNYGYLSNPIERLSVFGDEI